MFATDAPSRAQRLAAAAGAGILAGLGCASAPAGEPGEIAEAKPEQTLEVALPSAMAAPQGERTSVPRPDLPPPTIQKAYGCCKGLNDCKGKGMCKTEDHECKGLNECKGKGGCKPMDC